MNITEYSLIKVMEECAEVQQACSKILSFGALGVGPYGLGSNTSNLRSELGDLMIAIQALEDVLDANLESTERELAKKLDRYLEFRNISEAQGILT